jgi:hypothetical protein
MSAHVERTWPTLGLTVALGVVGGALLGWATLALSNTDIGGPGWSLRGNGALIVEFAGGPALLAGGWVLLTRGQARLAALAAALTLLIELGVGFGPVLVGPRAGLQAQLLVGLGPAILALVVGLGLAPPRDRQALLTSAGVWLLVVGLSLGLPFLLFVIAPLLLPLVLVTPTFARYGRRTRVPSLVALPLALVAGTLGSQALLVSLT